MSDRPFIAARVEERVNSLVEAALRLAGWQERVIPYMGYGSSAQLRVMGRIVLAPPAPTNPVAEGLHEIVNRRGWRNFFVSPSVNAPFRVHVEGKVFKGRADRGGYIDIRVTDHDLTPGRRTIEIETRQSPRTTAEVVVVADDEKFGIVSDIDDTILTTFLPRPMIAFWNAFVVNENARTPVSGMAEMYRQLLAEHPGAPIVYVSTGAYDTVPFLTRFMARNKYPTGPLLMTDWGPTNTGWFRSGMEHKNRSLRELARDFPKIKWLLVGDDGQHDPQIYNEFADEQPKRVRAIAIRQLTATEHWLAHGTPAELPEARERATVKEVRAADGYGLLHLVRPLLAKKHKSDETAHAEPSAPVDVPADPTPDPAQTEVAGPAQ